MSDNKTTVPAVPKATDPSKEENDLQIVDPSIAKKEQAEETFKISQRPSLENEMVYVAASTLIWREVRKTHRYAGYYSTSASGQEHRIEAGTVFRSLDHLKSKVNDPQTVEHWIKSGAVIHRRTGDLGKPLPKTGVTLGNSTGDMDRDRKLGLDGSFTPENTPGVKWGFHPANIMTKPLNELQAMIADRDRSVEIPENRAACVVLLSSQHRD